MIRSESDRNSMTLQKQPALFCETKIAFEIWFFYAEELGNEFPRNCEKRDTWNMAHILYGIHTTRSIVWRSFRNTRSFQKLLWVRKNPVTTKNERSASFKERVSHKKDIRPSLSYRISLPSPEDAFIMASAPVDRNPGTC